jgi:hypothetical protein
LEKEHGVRFKPASLLKEMAESGRTFYGELRSPDYTDFKK